MRRLRLDTMRRVVHKGFPMQHAHWLWRPLRLGCVAGLLESNHLTVLNETAPTIGQEDLGLLEIVARFLGWCWLWSLARGCFLIRILVGWPWWVFYNSVLLRSRLAIIQR